MLLSVIYTFSDSYLIATKGTLKCPLGYESINTFEECKNASIAVGIPGWNGESRNGGSQRMPYCWVGIAGNSNFNGNGDSGRKYSASRLICKQDAQTTETPVTRGINYLINFSYSFLIPF